MTRTFSASLDRLYDMLAYIREQAIAAGFTEGEVAKIELAVEEALVNIISYGYPNSSGNIDIGCGTPGRTGIKIIIRDSGIPYNPLANAKKFDPDSPVEARTIGGYGIFFILNLMDEVDYRRDGNANLLTLVKYIA